MNKLETCKACEEYNGEKCSKMCLKCWKAIIESELGKCPLNKWIINLELK
jgi:hypothetical protein